MSKIFKIPAEVRSNLGKSASKALRKSGKLPAVIYGNKIDPLNVTIDYKNLNIRYQKGHFLTQICEIELDGKKYKTLPKVVTLHPVTDNIIHIDFFKPSSKHNMNIAVPIKYLNEENAKGLKQGGVLNITSREIELSCNIDNIPEQIEVDLINLEINQSIHQDSVKLPKDVSFANPNQENSLAAIVHKKQEVETTEEVTDDSEADDASNKEDSKAE